MSRIPQALDELMWLLADQESPEAIDSFIQRYPHLRREMTRRALAVKDLRQSRPQEDRIPVPAFRKPTSGPLPAPLKSFRLQTASLFVGAAGLVFAAFVAVRIGLAPAEPASESAAAVLGAPESAPMPAPMSTPMTKTTADLAQADRAGNAKAEPEAATAPAEGTTPSPMDARSPENPAKNLDLRTARKVTIRMEQADLEDAVRLVCASAGLEAQIAPGMPQFKINLEYRETPALEILREMGANFGFSVFEQGQGVVLIVPAVDSRFDP